jgi:hypothetical protein
MYKIIASFILKNNYDTTIDEDISNIIQLNPNKQYMIQLYRYAFSNVFANVKKDLIISENNSWIINSIPIQETIIKAPLICDLDYLINKIQTVTNNQMLLKLNEYGHIELSFDSSVSSVNISLSDLGILATPFLGSFNSAITTVTTIISPNVPVISDFNFINLNSNLIGSNSYIKTNDDKLTPTLTIYSNSSALQPYSYNEYVSRINMFWPITTYNIQNINFQLLDENLNPLIIMPGSQVDFNVCFAILEMF